MFSQLESNPLGSGFLYLNLSMVVVDSLKLIFPCDVFVGVSDRIQCHFFFFAGKTTEINESTLISI